MHVNSLPTSMSDVGGIELVRGRRLNATLVSALFPGYIFLLSHHHHQCPSYLLSPLSHYMRRALPILLVFQSHPQPRDKDVALPTSAHRFPRGNLYSLGIRYTFVHQSYRGVASGFGHCVVRFGGGCSPQLSHSRLVDRRSTS